MIVRPGDKLEALLPVYDGGAGKVTKERAWLPVAVDSLFTRAGVVAALDTDDTEDGVIVVKEMAGKWKHRRRGVAVGRTMKHPGQVIPLEVTR